MIIDHENNSIYTEDILKTKKNNEIKQIAKSFKIKLSYVIKTGERKSKTRNELIEEILKKIKE